MKKENRVVLKATGPNSSGKTVFLRKIKSFLRKEGYVVTGKPEEHSINIKGLF